jgi:thiol-disulfide isomerase/thioredoxin
MNSMRLFLIILGLLFVAACTQAVTETATQVETPESQNTGSDVNQEEARQLQEETADEMPEASDEMPEDDEMPGASDEMLDERPEGFDWRSAELVDVNSGETFTLDQFNTPVLIESFAVWCPTCTKQQRELGKLHDLNPEVVSVAINTDPNEDEAKVREHTQKNGFDWRYVVSPVEVTRALIDEFGTTVINAPSAPVILLCPDGTAVLLDNGVKDAEELNEAAMGCSS